MTPRVTVEAAGESFGLDYSLTFDRATLPAFGDYAPNHPDRAGILPGTKLTDLENVYPSGSNTYIKLDSKYDYEGCLFWGELRMQSSAGEPNLVNCAGAGKDPTAYGAIAGLVKCYGDDFYPWRATDSVFDGGLWKDPTLRRPGNAAPTDPDVWRAAMDASVGLHGGRGTLTRVEIRNVGDGINWVQSYNNAEQEKWFTELFGCWIHDLNFYRAPGASDGAHPDYIQLGVGKNLRSVGTYYGGPNKVGAEPGNPNAGAMVKQEVSAETSRLISNVTFYRDFFEGGVYSINHAKNTKYPNDFATFKVVDARFPYRADGRYITANPAYYGSYENPRVVTVNSDGTFIVGAPVTIKAGA